jgi:hypothetical protein
MTLRVNVLLEYTDTYLGENASIVNVKSVSAPTSKNSPVG